jgi:hypothetical protein
VVEPTRAPSSGAAAIRWLALFLVPFVVLVVRHWSWAPSTAAGDYAQYLLHAQAIAEGRPYSATGYIYNPAAGLIGPPNLPPGLPLTLAPLVAIGGVHTPLVRLLMIVSVVAFAMLSAWRLSRDMEPWQAALGSAIAAYAVEASLASVAPISDPGFAVFVWATILAVDKDGAWTWRRVLGVTALGFAAVLYRVAGAALVPALFLFAWLERSRLGIRPFIPAAIWSAAGLIGLAAGLVQLPFSERFGNAALDPGEHLRTFARQYRAALFDAELYPFPIKWNLANDAYHLVASLLLLLGLIILFRRRWKTFLATFSVAYLLMLLIAPVAEGRYAWPLYPLVGATIAVGATSVARRLAPSWAPRTRAIVTVAPVLVIFVLTLALEARRPAPASFVRHPDARALFSWIAQRGKEMASTTPMRVAFHNPRVLTLETGVAAMGIVPRTPPGQLYALDNSRMTHLVWQGSGLGTDSIGRRVPCVQRVADSLPVRFPDRFALEFQNRTFRVYRVLPGAQSSDGVNVRINWSDC